ncbi:hypothetical protein BD324DRAFT_633901 [Kockovaella imperatae]|uniref:GST N-terminal domain-containing protein n=1 Tax=Kockovaella imperatae TaxID=4999 RepID=A0A1Y1UAM0_9TREE|nr:hypothetical protein BD324DRAFT_633901 [Kockovaella imperatae]ORX35101.1 hypothetical protein BD324DRAFT_633901 [Kockovaella imperatae]
MPMEGLTRDQIDQIQFLDIESRLQGVDRSWSPNTVRVRMVLNYKKIPYVESYISYPDIRAFGEKYDLPLNTNYDPPRSTLPAILIRDKQGKVIKAMLDSRTISELLDKLYPDPPIFLLPMGDEDTSKDGTTVTMRRFVRLLSPAWGAGHNIVVPSIPSILDPRAKVYFVEDRAKDDPLGQNRSPEDWGAENPEDDWEPFIKELKALAELFVHSTESSPFLAGDKPCYEDFMLAAFITWFKRGSEANFKRLIQAGERDDGVNVLKRFYEACRPWVEGHGEVVELKD